MLSVKFIREGILLRENEIETTDESNISGGISGKIRNVKASDNVGKADFGMEKIRGKEREGDREAATIGNRIGDCGESAGDVDGDVDERMFSVGFAKFSEFAYRWNSTYALSNNLRVSM